MAVTISITSQAPKCDIMPLLKTRAKKTLAEGYTELRSPSARSCHVKPTSIAPYRQSTNQRLPIKGLPGSRAEPAYNCCQAWVLSKVEPPPQSHSLPPDQPLPSRYKSPLSPFKPAQAEHPEASPGPVQLSSSFWMWPILISTPQSPRASTFCPVLVVAIKSMRSENPVGNFLPSVPLRTQPSS